MNLLKRGIFSLIYFLPFIFFIDHLFIWTNEILLKCDPKTVEKEIYEGTIFNHHPIIKKIRPIPPNKFELTDEIIYFGFYKQYVVTELLMEIKDNSTYLFVDYFKFMNVFLIKFELEFTVLEKNGETILKENGYISGSFLPGFLCKIMSFNYHVEMLQKFKFYLEKNKN